MQDKKKMMVENTHFEEWESNYAVETYACV